MITGIYKIKNLINNKVYVGSAIDIKKRWRDHKWCLKENKHHNSHLQSSYNKYGNNRFEFLIILECDECDLLVEEKKLIKKYNADNNQHGYNVNDPEHVFLGRKHTKKTKKKLSLQKIGDKNPMYGKYGNEHHFFNKNHSIKSRNKMSLSHLGIPTNRRTHSKLVVDDVINIRRMFNEEKISQPKLATLFNVSYTTINKIIKEKMWVNV